MLPTEDEKMLAVIANNLKRIRESRGITQARLADLALQSQSAISKWELGQREMGLVEAIKLCEALGCSITELTASQ
jgi:transcriptional regulator with XRE-family HTH domain